MYIYIYSRYILDVLEELQNHKLCISDLRTSGITNDERLQGYFCSDTVFNLSNRVLSENEDFEPIQRKINEPELRKDFEVFCRRLREPNGSLGMSLHKTLA